MLELLLHELTFVIRLDLLFLVLLILVFVQSILFIGKIAIKIIFDKTASFNVFYLRFDALASPFHDAILVAPDLILPLYLVSRKYLYWKRQHKAFGNPPLKI